MTSNRSYRDTIPQQKVREELVKGAGSQFDPKYVKIMLHMIDQDIDEVVSDSGKATWREVISNRFASTEFKKVHADLYKAFTKQTTSKRFTFNA